MKTRNFLKAIINCHLLLLEVSANLSENEGRVVGGYPTTIESAPYIVQLFQNGNFICGGTLVSDRHVVTAAHCVKGETPESFTVVGGATHLTDYGIRSYVSKIMVPKAYKRKNLDFDVAVIKLKTPFRGAAVQPTALCTKAFTHGDEVKLYGWGRRMDKSDDTSVPLHTATSYMVDKYLCEKMFNFMYEITESMFCAFAPGISSCFGDSGGPVIINGEFCGIVSWGTECGSNRVPSVYTDMIKVLPFIESAIQQ